LEEQTRAKEFWRET